MKTKKQKATDRGNELLLPFDATTKQVASIELSLATFGTLATAKAWAKNHGFDAVETSSRSEGFAIKCRAEEDFEDGSLRREVVGKSRVTALVGELTARALEADLERAKNAPVEEPSSSEPAEPTDEPTDEVEFAKAGELFVVSKAAAGEVEEEEDDPTEVRMFGIVMKPDVPDSEGDVTSAEEIENANFEFMKSFQTIGFMHKKDVSEVVKIIQDVVAPIDFEFPLPDGTTKAISKGTWFQEL